MSDNNILDRNTHLSILVKSLEKEMNEYIKDMLDKNKVQAFKKAFERVQNNMGLQGEDIEHTISVLDKIDPVFTNELKLFTWRLRI